MRFNAGGMVFFFFLVRYCKNSCSKTMYSRYEYLTLQRWFKRIKSLPVFVV